MERRVLRRLLLSNEGGISDPFGDAHLLHLLINLILSHTVDKQPVFFLLVDQLQLQPVRESLAIRVVQHL